MGMLSPLGSDKSFEIGSKFATDPRAKTGRALLPDRQQSILYTTISCRSIYNIYTVGIHPEKNSIKYVFYTLYIFK